MHNVLLLIVHGSRDPKWCAPFERLEQALQEKMGKDRVYLTHMEIAHPRLDEVVSSQVEKGVTSFKVLPLFMASGGHVDRDIPRQVQALLETYPGIHIEQMAPIGENPKVVEAIFEVVNLALT